ncbi:hypothetical protein B0H16DRAFT_1744970 [Mycena metata]|uniref:Uncharacterized protein n=1 Tax=Mycena metata TaxID=1033252 RepID=A0AAD7H4F7_9AGAR|nr:hypothetical protein B0H16DRAFT_1744970 [Mycena metata]
MFPPNNWTFRQTITSQTKKKKAAVTCREETAAELGAQRAEGAVDAVVDAVLNAGGALDAAGGVVNAGVATVADAGAATVADNSSRPPKAVSDDDEEDEEDELAGGEEEEEEEGKEKEQEEEEEEQEQQGDKEEQGQLEEPGGDREDGRQNGDDGVDNLLLVNEGEGDLTELLKDDNFLDLIRSPSPPHRSPFPSRDKSPSPPHRSPSPSREKSPSPPHRSPSPPHQSPSPSRDKSPSPHDQSAPPQGEKEKDKSLSPPHWSPSPPRDKTPSPQAEKEKSPLGPPSLPPQPPKTPQGEKEKSPLGPPSPPPQPPKTPPPQRPSSPPPQPPKAPPPQRPLSPPPQPPKTLPLHPPKTPAPAPPAAKQPAPQLHAPRTTINLGGGSWGDRRGMNDHPQLFGKIKQKRHLGEAQKASMKLKRDLRKKSKAEMQLAVGEYHAKVFEATEDLALKYSKTVDDIHHTIRGMDTFKRRRSTSLHNAKVWCYTQEINAGREDGQKYKVNAVAAMLKNSTRFDGMTKSEAATLLTEFKAYKSAKLQATPHLSHAAAAREVNSFTKKMEVELDAMREQTGALTFLVVARSDVDDTLRPGIYGPNEALDYFPHCMSMTGHQFTLKYNHWAVNCDATALDVGYAALRKETTGLIANSLEAKVGKKVIMKYSDYDAILTDHGYKLIGWPADIPFAAPRNLATVDKLCPLRDALLNGTCRWEAMSTERKAEHAAKVTAAAAADVRKKKERSDKGKTRSEAAAEREKCKRDEGEERAEHIRNHKAKKKRQQRAKLRGEDFVSEKNQPAAPARKKRKGAGEEDDGAAAKRKRPARGRGVLSRPTVSDSKDGEYTPAQEKGKGKRKGKGKETEKSDDKEEEEEEDEEEEDDKSSDDSRSDPRRPPHPPALLSPSQQVPPRALSPLCRHQEDSPGRQGQDQGAQEGRQQKAALAGSDRGALQQKIAAHRSPQKHAPGPRPTPRPVASTSRLPKTLTQVNLSPSDEEAGGTTQTPTKRTTLRRVSTHT